MLRLGERQKSFYQLEAAQGDTAWKGTRPASYDTLSALVTATLRGFERWKAASGSG